MRRLCARPVSEAARVGLHPTQPRDAGRDVPVDVVDPERVLPRELTQRDQRDEPTRRLLHAAVWVIHEVAGDVLQAFEHGRVHLDLHAARSTLTILGCDHRDCDGFVTVHRAVHGTAPDQCALPLHGHRHLHRVLERGSAALRRGQHGAHLDRRVAQGPSPDREWQAHLSAGVDLDPVDGLAHRLQRARVPGEDQADLERAGRAGKVVHYGGEVRLVPRPHHSWGQDPQRQGHRIAGAVVGVAEARGRLAAWQRRRCDRSDPEGREVFRHATSDHALSRRR